MSAGRLRVLAASLAVAMLARSSSVRADTEAPARIQIATGAELATTTGSSSNDVFIGPYVHLSYRLMPSISIGVVGAYGAIGTSVGDDNLDCGSGSERHLWRLAAGVRAHSSGLEPLEAWGGIESGVGVMHSIYTVSCAAGPRGPAFEHRSLLDQVAPITGPAAGVSLFVGRHVSIDLAVRGMLAFFPADDRPGTDNLGTRAIVVAGVGASIHFGR